MSKSSSRLLALDYLRGFFIIVIIIDHLWRWPSIYAGITGEGQLWVTSAEGFVIISGLLIGYVRGYKNRALPILEVSKKLWMRALLLYVWLIGATLIYTAMVWYIQTRGATAWIPIPHGNWNQLVTTTLTMANAHVWVHFLAIYVALLALTPPIVWLLRKGQWYSVIIITVITYIIGRVWSIEFLQWTPMFYLPAIAGYHMETIQHWWKQLPSLQRQTYVTTILGATIITIVISAIMTFAIPAHPVASILNHAFTKELSFNVARVPMALLWFTGFVLVFEYGQKFIGRYFGWLLLPFGTRSLTAYIAHGLILFIIALLFMDTPNIWYNTAIGTLAVIATWGLISLPVVQKVVPR